MPTLVMRAPAGLPGCQDQRQNLFREVRRSATQAFKNNSNKPSIHQTHGNEIKGSLDLQLFGGQALRAALSYIPTAKPAGCLTWNGYFMKVDK